MLYPFNTEYVGTSEDSEFRKWTRDHFGAFRHDLPNAMKDDKILFSLRVDKGQWLIVGEAVVVSNHKVGTEKDTCPLCKVNSDYDKDFRVHIQTKNYLEYENTLNAKDEGIRLGRFAIIHPDVYEMILETGLIKMD